ncbi:MAG: cytochrome C biogenesis protein, partial [Arenimonas sp.]|nr:cytochrome C biogenesis protein [Arenimonas sp.]
MTRWLLALLAALLFAPATRAVDEADLLPIDQAFALSARATDRGRIEFTWQIAEGYYLYRHRMGAQVADASFTANPLELPAGDAYTDEFFGDVETYRQQVTAVLTGTAAKGASAVTVKVKYQGCADIGICYPPHTQTLTVALPPADPGSESALVPPAASGGLFGAPAGGGAALPEAQAFGVEAIVAAPDQLLLRFTPAPGYYLYRDRTTITLEADGASAGTPAWPPAQAHRDEHFGEVQVFFEPIDVPLPLLRTRAEAMPATVVVAFQGCQTDGICYPPMVRRIELQLPAGAATDAAPRETPPARASTSLWLALLLALGGGMVL